MEQKISGISINIVVHEEIQDGKKVFVVEYDGLGIADFGYTLGGALDNIKEAARLL